MATFTGYFKTEKVLLSTNQWSFAQTSVNAVLANQPYNSLILGEMHDVYAASLNTTLYMQNEADPDFFLYYVLNTTASNGPEVEYNSTNTATPIYSSITSTAIFTSDQDFSAHNILWNVKYNAKVANTPVGQTPYIDFKFYKVNTSSVETLLFTIRANVTTSYSASPKTASGLPAGSVTTSDRLCIKAFYGSSIPG